MKLIVGSIVGNEKDNYLEEWLTNVKGYADLHIVIDDASTDGSNKILEASGAIVTRNKESLFKTDEAQLRTQLWEKIRAHAKKGDWIFIVDSDEFYDSPKAEILANCKGEVAAIKLCDMWSEEEYRIDGYWSPYFHRLFELGIGLMILFNKDYIHPLFLIMRRHLKRFMYQVCAAGIWLM